MSDADCRLVAMTPLQALVGEVTATYTCGLELRFQNIPPLWKPPDTHGQYPCHRSWQTPTPLEWSEACETAIGMLRAI